ncbi:S41 family peptidase [Solitalea koreensis]|uniref:Peptidase family S41 n=1 Tax=Solitalea koreensis TaxID=543615 RepID=A0A521BGX3_9SPHI|nr:S41 family peptidase [Solitalea koreensis]SMO46333.1 Peptidase family S41 [Solitalea koreensis]
MKKLLFAAFLILQFTSQLSAQHLPNLNFEKLDTLKTGALGWVATLAGDMNHVSIDSSTVQSGINSIKLEGNLKDAVALYLYKLPANFLGDSIKLTGYIKTENLTQGWAGLYLQINGPNGTLAKENMSTMAVSGTNDWQEYSITLPLDLKSTEIVIGGLLNGKGIAWIDNFKLFIDGIPLAKITKVPVYKKFKPVQPFKSFLTLKNLNTQEVSNLALLAKVWGFLKYHHPAVASGEKDWDKSLFVQIDAIKSAKNIQERSNLLLAWIKSLGEVKPCDSCKDGNAFVKMNPDFAWMNDKRSVSPELIDQLNLIQRNRYRGTNHYVTMASAGNPDFSNEKIYTNADLSDDGVRMLGLFRYWNIIQYYYPYRYAIGQDWNKVLTEFIPKVSGSVDSVSYQLTMLQLISRINDSQANLISDKVINKQFGERNVSFASRLIGNKLVVSKFYIDSLARICPLHIGDVITRIDSSEVDDKIKVLAQYSCASTRSAVNRNIVAEILTGNTANVDITYEREGITATATIQRYPLKTIDYGVKELSDSRNIMFELMGPEVGYINLEQIDKNKVPEIFEKFRNTKGIIIDIRNQPKESVALTLSKHIKPYSTPFIRFTTFSLQKPGMFEEAATISSGEKNPDYYKGKVVILVNELTQGQAEYITMALQSGPNTTVIGSQTAGADGNVSTIILPGNLKTSFSGIGVYYPDGRETQRVGIIPDIEAKPTTEGLRAHRDEVLERAIQFIKTNQ